MSNTIKASEAMQMNRRDRRRLGSINKVKIPGIKAVVVTKTHNDNEFNIINKILEEKK
jgi:hypothetical protein